jgi:GNAT superfamily N-acetyltransferase
MPPVAIEIVRLEEPLDRALVAELEEILESAQSDLVRPNERFENVLERLGSGDPARELWMARVEDRAAGLADLELQSPGPGDLTVSAIATAPWARFRGVGRALVIRAIERHPELDGALVAGVHKGSRAALAFWSALGLVRSGRGAVLSFSCPLSTLRAP